ncbi:MAG: dihydroorotase [Candidatus Jordarchaeum sp.]|uniref:dihydroorotase n=1 Tax=Candidatus Jordarchaeum sp. TaxID=2823881 RepID=UPI004048EC5F
MVLKNARVFTFQGIITGGVAVDEGKVVKLSKEPESLRADEVLDAKGFLLLPGLIDAHVHMRDMQLSYKEDFYTASCAAAAGGITTVIDMPNTIPRTCSLKALREKMEEAKKKTLINIAFYAGFPSKLTEVKQMTKEGIVGFKLYPHDPFEEIDLANEEQAQIYFKAAAENNVPVSIHPDDLETIKKLQSKLKLQKLSDIEIFLGSHPAESERKAIAKYAELGAKTGCHIHFCHISSMESLAAIKKEQGRGVKITCESTPHHLLLTKEELEKLNTFAKVLPPLRSKNDNIALWAALLDGLINMIVSDHAPHSLQEKQKPFLEAPSGFPGLETLFPVMLTKVAHGDLRLEKLVEMTSSSPSKIFKVGNKGMLREGYDADMVLVDIKEKWKIDPEKFYSKSKFSPFKDWKVVGKVRNTFINGSCIMSDDEITAPKGIGSIIQIRH